MRACRCDGSITHCRRHDNHFVCHKGAEGQIIHCRGVHDILGGSRAFRFAKTFDIPIREIDPDQLEQAHG